MIGASGHTQPQRYEESVRNTSIHWMEETLGITITGHFATRVSDRQSIRKEEEP